MKPTLVSILVITLIAVTGSSPHAKAGGSFETMDIVILMDASGSILSSVWRQEKDFVVQFLDSYRSMQDRIAIVKFSTVTTIVHGFDDDQSNEVIRSKIYDMSHDRQSGFMLDAIVESIELFDAQSPPSHDRLIMLITDGTPFPSTQNPCINSTQSNDLFDALRSRSIHTVIVGVGGEWDPNLINCLVSDPTEDIVELQNVNEEFLGFEKFRTGGPGDGDFDGNNIIEMNDYAMFFDCFVHATWPKCRPANLTGDGGVIDLADFAEFQIIFGQSP